MTDLPATPEPGRLSIYGDLADVIERMPVIVREARRSRRLSLRAAEAASGVGYTTLARVEAGTDLPSVGTLLKILRWLDT